MSQRTSGQGKNPLDEIYVYSYPKIYTLLPYQDYRYLVSLKLDAPFLWLVYTWKEPRISGILCYTFWTFQVALVVRIPPANAGDTEPGVQFLDWDDPLEKEVSTHSSILAWKIPWTEEPSRLQSMGSQRVRHDCLHPHAYYI